MNTKLNHQTKPSEIHDIEPPLDIVVLMAGAGKRLLPLTADRPKALLEIENGSTIFDHIIEVFNDVPLQTTFIPVIGHGRSNVLDVIAERKSQMIRPVANPFYAGAGPLVSLWLGLLQSRSERVVFLNGDTVIREELVFALVNWLKAGHTAAKPNISVCVSKSDCYVADDMKVLTDEQGIFKRAGKDLDIGPYTLKSAGVIALKQEGSKKALAEKLENLLMQEKALDNQFYWHNILNEVKNDFIIDLIMVSGTSWCEIDTNSDFISVR